MRHQRTLPGFASTEEQNAALLEWKERAAAGSTKVKAFTNTLKMQRRASKMAAQKQQWVRERATLREERRKAHYEFITSLQALDNVASDKASSEASFNFAVRAVIAENKAANESRCELAELLLGQAMALRQDFISAREVPLSERKKVIGLLRERNNILQRLIEEESRITDKEFATLSETAQKGCVDKEIEALLPSEGCAATMESSQRQSKDWRGELEQEMLSVGRRFSDASPQIHADFEQLFNQRADEYARKLLDSGSGTAHSAMTDSTLADFVLAILPQYAPEATGQSETRSHELLRDRVMLHFPKSSERSVRQAVRAAYAVHIQRRAEAVIVHAARTELHRLLAEYQAAAENDIKHRVMEAQRREEFDAAKRQRDELRGHVGAFLQQKQIEDEQRRATLAEAEQKVEEIYAQRKLLYEKDLARRAASAAAIREAGTREQTALLAEKRAAQQRELAERMAANAARVDVRQREYEEKCEALRLREEQKLADQRKREKAFSDFFMSVEAQIGVQTDPVRVAWPTQAAEARKGEQTLTLREAEVKFGSASTHGYSSDAITKNPVFRIHSALIAAGLQGTPYAQDLLRQRGVLVPARTKER